MNIDFSIEEVVKKRYSVRNYKEQEIESDKRNDIESFIDSLDNPLGNKVKFHYLDNEDIKNKEKLGTYGVIKGANQYIGTTIKLEPMALEALGYEVEAEILYLAHLGLGTCWLGGTFDRGGFADAMKIKEGEVFPIITPYGYATTNKHEIEIEMRKMIQADHRKEWNELFYKNDFMEVNYKRVKLDIKATELYPEDYDFNQLFTSYKDFYIGKSFDAYEFFGAHKIGDKILFRVYAPNAAKASLNLYSSEWEKELKKHNLKDEDGNPCTVPPSFKEQKIDVLTQIREKGFKSNYQKGINPCNDKEKLTFTPDPKFFCDPRVDFPCPKDLKTIEKESEEKEKKNGKSNSGYHRSQGNIA